MSCNSNDLRRTPSIPYCQLLLPILTGCLALGLGGCGEDGGTQSTGPQLVLEVPAPIPTVGSEVAALDYQIACDDEWTTIDEAGVFVPEVRRDGTMELAGSDAEVWRATEEPLGGFCLLNLIARDDGEQSVWIWTETFSAVDGEETLVRVTGEADDLVTFEGVASLTADAPLTVLGEDINSVEYSISCDGGGIEFFERMDPFDPEIAINGNLEVATDEETGSGRVQHSFEGLPPGACSIQLRAPDADGEVICVGDADFTIAPNQTELVPVVIVCSL